ncbi:MAG: hypothetical protein ACXW0L_04095, partial [Methylosarcina sp.]
MLISSRGEHALAINHNRRSAVYFVYAPVYNRFFPFLARRYALFLFMINELLCVVDENDCVLEVCARQ